MAYETLEEALEFLDGTEALVTDGFDDCIIGIASRCGQMDLIVYDSDKIIDKLVEDGMEYEDAVEHFNFNIVGGWHGKGTPLFMTPIERKQDEHIRSTPEECGQDSGKD